MEERKQNQKGILRRVYLVYLVLLLMAVGILSKIVIIQFVEGEKWVAKVNSSTTIYKNIPAVRGNIYTSDGSLLATSIPIYEVRFDPNIEALSQSDFDENVDSLAYYLAELFQDKSQSQYRIELVSAREAGSRYHLIRRKVNYNQLKAMRQFPIFKRGKYKGGFIYHQKNKRERPFRKLAARTIGYEREGVQPVGLEGAYTHVLSGVNGKRLMQKIAGGVWMPINDENEIEPQDGLDIVTTIDLNIQDVAHHALESQLLKQDADHGCVVLMEVSTGNIKAIVNLSRGKDGAYYEQYNYAIGESTEPGSTFKLPVYMVAMEDGYIDLEDTVATGKGKFQFYDAVMEDSRHGGYGTITVKDAFAYSSNIGVAKLISRYYSKNPQSFIDRLYKMNLNQTLGIEIFGEGRPLIKSADDKSWSGISLPWISHGYELQMTPLQILAFYNAVANDGVLVKPKFVKELRRMGEVVEQYEPVILNNAIASKSTISKARKMLEAVVEYGTATNLRNKNFKIAGKTGTAQIANSKYGYSYESKVSYQASFCGYFPADKPKYSCIVVVNAPSKYVYYGNLVAGPIFKEISDKVYATSIQIHDELQKEKPSAFTAIPVAKNGYKKDLQYIYKSLDVPYNDQEAKTNWVITMTGKDKVDIKNRKVIQGLVPNVIGMDLQNAIYLLENMGLEVIVEGRGVVKEQSINSGVRVPKGGRIKLHLA